MMCERHRAQKNKGIEKGGAIKRMNERDKNNLASLTAHSSEVPSSFFSFTLPCFSFVTLPGVITVVKISTSRVCVQHLTHTPQHSSRAMACKGRLIDPCFNTQPIKELISSERLV